MDSLRQDWKQQVGNTLFWATGILLVGGFIALGVGTFFCRGLAWSLGVFMLVAAALTLIFLTAMSASGATSRAWLGDGGEDVPICTEENDPWDGLDFDFACDF